MGRGVPPPCHAAFLRESARYGRNWPQAGSGFSSRAQWLYGSRLSDVECDIPSSNCNVYESVAVMAIGLDVYLPKGIGDKQTKYPLPEARVCCGSRSPFSFPPGDSLPTDGEQGLLLC